jgi:hypothetical protein
MEVFEARLSRRASDEMIIGVKEEPNWEPVLATN